LDVGNETRLHFPLFRHWGVPTNLAGALAESLSTHSNHPVDPVDVSETGKGSIDTKASRLIAARFTHQTGVAEVAVVAVAHDIV